MFCCCGGVVYCCSSDDEDDFTNFCRLPFIGIDDVLCCGGVGICWAPVSGDCRFCGCLLLACRCPCRVKNCSVGLGEMLVSLFICSSRWMPSPLAGLINDPFLRCRLTLGVPFDFSHQVQLLRFQHWSQTSFLRRCRRQSHSDSNRLC